MLFNKTGCFFIYTIYWIFMFLYNVEEATAAVPIDIATETPGRKYRPIMMFIPDKKPLISRRQRGRPDRYEYYDNWYNRPNKDRYGYGYGYGSYNRDRRRPPHRYDYYDNLYRHKYPKGDWYKHAEKRGNWYRVKYQDSYYVDDISVPFLMADTWHRVPSVDHGAAIKTAQVIPLMKRMLTAGFFNNEVMEAVKKWQYHNRFDNRWKLRYRRKLIQSGKLKRNYRGDREAA